MRVNAAQCNGCGACIEICPSAAISLNAGIVVIDQATCTQCQACVDACPEDAITAIELPVVAAEPVAVQPVRKPEIVVAPPVPSSPKSWLRAALAFLGREIAPRLADAMIAALERRLARPTTTAVAPISAPSRNLASQGGGERRQARYRRGRAADRNHRERR